MPTSCVTCSHESLADIDAALLAGQPIGRVATRYGIVDRSLKRHKRNHLMQGQPESTTPLADGTAVETMREQIRGLKADLAATNSPTSRTDIRREIRLAATALAAAEGPPKPAVVDLVDIPEFIEFLNRVYEVLVRHDDHDHPGVDAGVQAEMRRAFGAPPRSEPDPEPEPAEETGVEAMT